ncbi:hypothetical protein M0802_015023 [Mischocyttarus mexicanus]|nr:hypothetical protein M0802_015023 [Mischocyttarus mexicanus]
MVRILLQPTPAGRRRRPLGTLVIMMRNSGNLGWSGGIHSAAVQDGVLTGHSSSIAVNCQSTTVGNLAVGMVKATGAESQVRNLACDLVYTTGKRVGSSVGSRKRIPSTAGLEQVNSDAAMRDLEERGLGLAGGSRLGELGASLDYCRTIDKIRKCLDTVKSDRKKSSSLKGTASCSMQKCIAYATKSLQELKERNRSGRTDYSVEERASCLRGELLALEAKNSALQDEIARLKAAVRKEEKKIVKNDQSGSAADLSGVLWPPGVRDAEPLLLAQLYEGFGQLTIIARDLVGYLKTRGGADVIATHTTGSGAPGSDGDRRRLVNPSGGVHDC